MIAQAVSAYLVMRQLIRTSEAYRVELKKIRFHREMIRQILMVGLPAALQQSITAFSNVVVQSYINSFGTAAVLRRSLYYDPDRWFFTACTAEL